MALYLQSEELVKIYYSIWTACSKVEFDLQMSGPSIQEGLPPLSNNSHFLTGNFPFSTL
jgi:hypothetical protein